MTFTIRQAAEAIRQGQHSPVELLDRCLERIDRCEDQVRAWVLIDRPRARAEAELRARELRAGLDRGPLHGIPLGIKDIIDVFDWPTACGSKLWKDAVARHDAPVVRQLREAGAVLIGKTVTTAYASFDPPPTRNPWGLSRTPGGSSSGSAAAVACGMCLGALGSQTGGSITRPASYCGVAACKPTVGRTLTTGVLPLAESMDHIGPMARCVEDVGLITRAILNDRVGDPTRGAGRTQPPRLGRLRGLFERLASDEVRAMMDDVCARLTAAGAVVEEVALPTSFDDVIDRHRTVMAVEAANYHKERLARHPEDYGPCITQLLQEGLACPAVEYARAKDLQRDLGQADMSGCFGPRIVALIAPATTGPAPDAATTGDPAFNSPWSFTGLPVVSFPVARNADGLPLAIQLVGQAFGEPHLFTAAAWCEGALAFTLGEPPVVAPRS